MTSGQGAGRWQYPVVITGWEGVLDATRFGPNTMQQKPGNPNKKPEKPSFYEHEFREGLPYTFSEDGLCLNIYVPEGAVRAPVIVYVREHRIMFPVPIPEKAEPVPYSPKSFKGLCHIIRARFATPEELAVRRNLAFNPYDHDFYGRAPFGNGVDTGFFPHAVSNIKSTSPGFAPRTAIDGVFENNAHLLWPCQAWSNDRDPNAELTIDFGRNVVIDELRLTLRADFPHDSWWERATVRFSDGSSEELALIQSAEPQIFPINPRTVTSLTLCDLKKHEDQSLYTALTQIEAWGTEAEIRKEGAEQ